MVSRPRFAARAICVSGFCGVTFTSKGPVTRWLMWAVSFKSVRHRRHLPGEGFLEAEVAQVRHPLRKQDALEVIDLVLHEAGVKPLHRPVDRRPVRIEALVAKAAK